MAIVALQCPHCGGNLELEDSREFGFCMYCGTKIVMTRNDAGGSSLDGQVGNIKPLMDSFFRDGEILEAQKHARKIIEINGADADVWYVDAVAGMYLSPDGSDWESSLKNYEIMSGRKADRTQIEDKCRQYAAKCFSRNNTSDICKKWMKGIESFDIPSSWTTIGKDAFSDFSSLKSVTIPPSVTTIGEGAFRLCVSLTSIDLPCSVDYIDKEAFFGCSSLESVTLPSSLRVIGESAFRVCSSLKSMALPPAVESIGPGAFYGCTSLESVTIPSSVKVIGPQAFFNCKSLVDVSLPPSVEIGPDAFEKCPFKLPAPKKKKGGLFDRLRS